MNAIPATVAVDDIDRLAPVGGRFALSDLPYEISALEPVIDAETMHLHHDKHHRGYVDGLNAALQTMPDLTNLDLEAVMAGAESAPPALRSAIQNMGGGHLNHSVFWRCMSKQGGTLPASLSRALAAAFGSVDAFMQHFKNAGLRQFGSGWVSLCVDPTAEPGLEIVTFANQDTWVGSARRPLLICDIWEHAYYLRYRNRRADWLDHWWQVVDWEAAETRWQRAKAQQDANLPTDRTPPS